MSIGEKKIISACLYGQICRFDGKNKKLPNLSDYKKGCCLIPVCPEILGGLPVPRPRARINSGTGKDVLDGKARIVDENGKDVTDYYIDGAKKTLQIAIDNNVKKALFKSKSPSCGFGRVHNAEGLVEGNGVTAELLIRNGIKVVII